MYNGLIKLSKQIDLCRTAAREDDTSPCHNIVKIRCQQEEIKAGLIWPSPEELTNPIEIVTVGINPNWSVSEGANLPEGNCKKNTGKTFNKYQEQILNEVREALPTHSIIAHLDLVPCGTSNGRMVRHVIDRCRKNFFDKVILTIKPKLIIAIGQYASENLYWNNCIAGRSGKRWEGLRKKHATVEEALLGEHKCQIVFVLQPSSYVSTEKRIAASNAIFSAYINDIA